MLPQGHGPLQGQCVREAPVSRQLHRVDYVGLLQGCKG